jgi:hypothetical protein
VSATALYPHWSPLAVQINPQWSASSAFEGRVIRFHLFATTSSTKRRHRDTSFILWMAAASVCDSPISKPAVSERSRALGSGSSPHCCQVVQVPFFFPLVLFLPGAFMLPFFTFSFSFLHTFLLVVSSILSYSHRRPPSSPASSFVRSVLYALDLVAQY